MNSVRHRVLALVLAVAFVFSIAAPTFATGHGEYFTDASEFEGEYYEDAAYWIGHSGVFVGDEDGNLNPNSEFTRAQMAVVLARMTGQEDLAERLEMGTTDWTDDDEIPNWARGYMVLAEARGWFQGYPDGTVRTNEALTYAEIAALLARVTDNEHLLEGSWPTSTIIAAGEMGLFEDIPDAVIAEMPIFRKEMVSATFKAMLTPGKLGEEDEDGESLEEECLMAKNFEDTFDAWEEAEGIAGQVTGEFEDYLSRSDRIEVGGDVYDLVLDADDAIDVTVIVNDAELNWTDFETDVFDEFVEEDVTITLNDDDEIIEMEFTFVTYEDEFLTAVTVDEDEPEYGTITVAGDELDVDPDTEILLNGEEATLEEIETAFDDFQTDWDVDPIISVRTEGNVAEDGEYATYVSVLTDNTVTGEVTARGSDWVAIDSVEYDFDTEEFDRDAFGFGAEMTLLLDSQDVIRTILEEETPEAAEYFGIFRDYAQYSTDEYDVDLELADGSEITLALDMSDEGDEFDPDELTLDTVVYVEEDTDGYIHISNVDDSGLVPEKGTYYESTSSWIRVDDENGDRYILEEDVFYYDVVNEEFIARGDLAEGDVIELFGIEDDVGYVRLLEEEGPDTFTLTVNTDGEGTVDVDPDQEEYEDGTEVTLTATADEGYVFDGWTGDVDTTTDNVATVTMDGDKDVTATFVTGLDVTDASNNVTATAGGSYNVDPQLTNNTDSDFIVRGDWRWYATLDGKSTGALESVVDSDTVLVPGESVDFTDTSSVDVPETAGTYDLNVVVVDADDNPVFTDSYEITVEAGAVDSVTVTGDDELDTNGVTGEQTNDSYAAVVEDEYGNEVDNQDVTWSVVDVTGGDVTNGHISIDATTGEVTWNADDVSVGNAFNVIATSDEDNSVEGTLEVEIIDSSAE